jgi:hypothetical protein
MFGASLAIEFLGFDGPEIKEGLASTKLGLDCAVVRPIQTEPAHHEFDEPVRILVVGEVLRQRPAAQRYHGRQKRHDIGQEAPLRFGKVVAAEAVRDQLPCTRVNRLRKDG